MGFVSSQSSDPFPGSYVSGSGLVVPKKKPSIDEQVKNRYLDALDPTQARGNLALDEYMRRATSFDPSGALRTYGNAAYGDFETKLNRDMADLAGKEVGAGRLDTGFFNVDRGNLVKDLAGQYQRDLASHALQAEGLGLQNTEDLGRFGEGEQNTYLDLLSGEMDRETAKSNAKKAMIGNIVGGLASAAGKVIPFL